MINSFRDTEGYIFGGLWKTQKSDVNALHDFISSESRRMEKSNGKSACDGIGGVVKNNHNQS